MGSFDEKTLFWGDTSSTQQALKDGRKDGLSKARMSPVYMEMVGTMEDAIGKAYAKAYKEGREDAYKATGSRRHKKLKKKARKTRRVRKLNGR